MISLPWPSGRSLVLLAVLAVAGCSGEESSPDTGGNLPDAASVRLDASGQAGEDAAQVGQDSGPLGADAAQAGEDASQVVGEDAAQAGPDAAQAGEDAGQPGEDAGQVGVDAGQPGEDAATAGPDAAQAGSDAAAPGLDAATAGPDAGTVQADAGGEPPVGELGGVCGPGGACQVGTCEDLGGAYGKRCTQACWSNYECPTQVRCEAVTVDSMYCLAGPRGTGAIGAPCGAAGEKGLGCVSGICIDADPVQAIAVDTCTEVCASDPDCAPPFPVCQTMFGLCLPISSGDLGGLCRASGGCYSGQGACLDVAGLGMRCTKVCTDSAECGQPWLECRQAGAYQYCLIKP